VRGIELGPISYRRRPSTSCPPPLAESLGYTVTIAGLEYFSHQILKDSSYVDQVRTLPRSSPWDKSTCGGLRLHQQL
jgi:hypothetical protein